MRSTYTCKGVAPYLGLDLMSFSCSPLDTQVRRHHPFPLPRWVPGLATVHPRRVCFHYRGRPQASSFPRHIFHPHTPNLSFMVPNHYPHTYFPRNFGSMVAKRLHGEYGRPVFPVSLPCITVSLYTCVCRPPTVVLKLKPVGDTLVVSKTGQSQPDLNHACYVSYALNILT